MNFDPEMMGIISDMIDARLRAAPSIQLGIVSTYDAVNRRADVLPLVGVPSVDRFTREVTWTDGPLICDIPIAYLGTPRSTEHVPLDPGDTGIILTIGHSIDEILDAQSPSPVRPRDRRGNALMDSFFLPVDWMAVSPLSGETDRHITGENVVIGALPAAAALATVEELNTLRGIVAAHIHASTATPMSGPPAELAQVVIPFSGTSHLRAS